MTFNLELGKLGQKIEINNTTNTVVITANTLSINTSATFSNSLSVGTYLVVNTSANIISTTANSFTVGNSSVNVICTSSSISIRNANTLTINSTAIIFPDSSVQTTAGAAGGIDSGTALAFAIALG